MSNLRIDIYQRVSLSINCISVSLLNSDQVIVSSLTNSCRNVIWHLLVIWNRLFSTVAPLKNKNVYAAISRQLSFHLLRFNEMSWVVSRWRAADMFWLFYYPFRLHLLKFKWKLAKEDYLVSFTFFRVFLVVLCPLFWEATPHLIYSAAAKFRLIFSFEINTIT